MFSLIWQEKNLVYFDNCENYCWFNFSEFFLKSGRQRIFFPQRAVTLTHNGRKKWILTKGINEGLIKISQFFEKIWFLRVVNYRVCKKQRARVSGLEAKHTVRLHFGSVLHSGIKSPGVLLWWLREDISIENKRDSNFRRDNDQKKCNLPLSMYLSFNLF